MIELEPTKAKRVTIPKRVKRYSIAYYTTHIGWQNTTILFTTPESALEEFLRWYKDTDSRSTPKFYKVFELDLEIPVIAPSND
jgi:hypothetical protein